ncbi:MAG TPA: hypothetical protein VGE51_08930 [Fontimonas sp.]
MIPLSDAARQRLSKLMQLGFWFFLVKGLLWLCIPLAAVYFGWQAD